jgi:hypothetical protein
MSANEISPNTIQRFIAIPVARMQGGDASTGDSTAAVANAGPALEISAESLYHIGLRR